MTSIAAVVAQVHEIANGGKKQVKVGETDILLARLQGKFYAVGAYCTHYQAPLVEGVLNQERIVCPWHNACFNIMTGEQQEPPGLDSLPCYEVRIEGERVIVTVPEPVAKARTLPMAKYNPDVDGRTFVVLGAGAAGSAAVEVLRQVGFQGRLMMITAEDKLPYDRTWLSKDYFIGKVSREQMPLRTKEFYKEHNIEILYSKQVVSVDAKAKTITFSDGGSLSYDALLLATGGTPRHLRVPGADLPQVLTLRSFDDADTILATAAPSSHAVVVGSSFIGMETAAGLSQKGLQVTVVSPESVPFEKILEGDRQVVSTSP